MAKRPRHKNKAIEAAVKYALKKGWTFVKSGGHRWGTLRCPESSREGCRWPVYSTPRHPEAHAKDIRHQVDTCPHRKGED